MRRTALIACAACAALMAEPDLGGEMIDRMNPENLPLLFHVCPSHGELVSLISAKITLVILRRY